MTRNQIADVGREMFMQQWKQSVRVGKSEDVIPIGLLPCEMAQPIRVNLTTCDAEDYFSHRFHGLFTDFRKSIRVSGTP